MIGVFAIECVGVATKWNGAGANHPCQGTSAKRSHSNYRRSVTPNHVARVRRGKCRSWMNPGARCSLPSPCRPNWMHGLSHTASRSKRSARSRMRIYVCEGRTWFTSCRCIRRQYYLDALYWIEKLLHFTKTLNRIHCKGHFHLKTLRSKYSLMIPTVLKLNLEMKWPIV